MVYCLRMVASHYNYTGLTLLCRAVFSPLAIVRHHHTQRQCFIAPCKQWAAGPCPPADYLKDLHYLRRIWACYGRTFFVMVGMVAQISAIQSIMEPQCRASCSDDSLPTHQQDLLDQTSRDLDGTQQRQLASVLLQ